MMIKKAMLHCGAGLTMLLLASGAASAADLPRYGIFVYTNFCTSAMSGDLYGSRITLRRLRDDETLLYEYTDGATHLVMAEKLQFDPGTGKISFEVHAGGSLDTTVVGVFSDHGKQLTVQGLLFNEAAKQTLRRVSNLSAPLPGCRQK